MPTAAAVVIAVIARTGTNTLVIFMDASFEGECALRASGGEMGYGFGRRVLPSRV
jgi:hypothetical protein